MKEPIAIFVGDVMVLNSGGPKMTVVEVEREQARCAWTSDTDELEVAWFPLVCLLRVVGSADVGVA